MCGYNNYKRTEFDMILNILYLLFYMSSNLDINMKSKSQWRHTAGVKLVKSVRIYYLNNRL